MTAHILQAVAFLLLSAAYVVRDYPWKKWGGKSRYVAGQVLLLLSLAALGSLVAVLVSGRGGEGNSVSGLFAVVAIFTFLVISILSLTAWPRAAKRDKESDDQRAV